MEPPSVDLSQKFSYQGRAAKWVLNGQAICLEGNRGRHPRGSLFPTGGGIF